MKRGRKSAASLAVAEVVIEMPQRPQPPVGFDPEMCTRWNEIVNDWPADRWRPSDLRLLEDMIRTERYVRDCDEIISREGMTVTGANGGVVSHPVVISRRGHLQTILGIQRALRLCPSTRVQKTHSSLTQGRQPAKKPWEM